jgi:two-component system sensor histidine kinase GlrK
MRLSYPKSFFKLLSIGFAVVALPLVLVLVGNAVSIRHLAERGQQAVFNAAKLTQTSRELVETLTSLERAARQYAVLGDAGLRENLRQQHRRFGELTQQLDALAAPAGERQQELAAIVAEEAQLFTALDARAPGKPFAASATDELTRFTPLADSAQKMLEHNSNAVQAAAESLQQLAAEASGQIYGQLAVLVPVTILVVVGFTYLLGGPIREIDHAIRGLGEGRFAERIEVSGPADLKQLGHRLDWLRLRLAQLEEQKNRFLRHASHELKTPLTALREGSDLLSEEAAGPLTPAQKEIARILRDNSLRLAGLIDDLLRHSAAEFQQTPLRLSACRPAEIIAAVAATQALPLAAKRLRLNVNTDDLLLDADTDRLRIIVDNLLSNAIKFSPEEATIAVRAYREGSDAIIEVADDGPGISPDDRERVFEPFYQGRIAAASAVKGSGLGLSIVREHALAHGGSVELVDRAAGGALFRVILPIEHR